MERSDRLARPVSEGEFDRSDRFAWDAEGVIVKRLQKEHRGIRSEAQSVKKVVSRGFNEPLVTEEQHRLCFDHAFVTYPGGGFATVAKHFHHIRPGAGDHFRVLRGEVGPGHHQIHQRLGDGVILGLDDPAGLGLVAGLQTFLLAGAAVLAVKNCAAPEQFETVLHVRTFQFTNTKTQPLASSEGVSKEGCGIVEELPQLTQFTDTFTDSWRFLTPLSPKILRFPKKSRWRKGWDSNGVRGFFQNPLLRNYHPTTRGEQPHN